jgi:pantetheine-phosphate adenylyltransferase
MSGEKVMNKIALFPGSFDPITIGHTDIIKRALPLFDKVVIAIGDNSKKEYLFSLEKRLGWIQSIFKNDKKVEAKSYDGLTVDFCKEVGAHYIVRGVRSSSDFEFEKKIAQLNRSLDTDIDTIFLISSPDMSHISSTIVREIYNYNGDISQFVPKEVVIN